MWSTVGAAHKIFVKHLRSKRAPRPKQSLPSPVFAEVNRDWNTVRIICLLKVAVGANGAYISNPIILKRNRHFFWGIHVCGVVAAMSVQKNVYPLTPGLPCNRFWNFSGTFLVKRKKEIGGGKQRSAVSLSQTFITSAYLVSISQHQTQN